MMVERVLTSSFFGVCFPSSEIDAVRRGIDVFVIGLLTTTIQMG